MPPATTATELDPTAESKTIWPEWLWTTDLAELPNSLEWYSGGWPPFSSYCEVNRRGKKLASGTVTHYFHATGKLYVVIAVDCFVESLKLVPGDSLIALYDDDFILLLDEDDEPTYPLQVPPSYEERAALLGFPVRAKDNGKDVRAQDGEQDNDSPF